MSNLVTIYTANIPEDIAVMQTYLEDNEIYCNLKGTHSSQVLAHVQLKAELQVREEDAERAVELLVKGGFVSADEYSKLPVSEWVIELYAKLAKFFGKD